MLFAPKWELSFDFFGRTYLKNVGAFRRGGNLILVEALYVISTIVRIFLTVLQLAMLLRAILSWFPMDSNKFLDFLYGITEPFIYPFRALFHKLGWFQNIPIDISFTVAYLAIFLLGILLP